MRSEQELPLRLPEAEKVGVDGVQVGEGRVVCLRWT